MDVVRRHEIFLSLDASSFASFQKLRLVVAISLIFSKAEFRHLNSPPLQWSSLTLNVVSNLSNYLSISSTGFGPHVAYHSKAEGQGLSP